MAKSPGIPSSSSPILGPDGKRLSIVWFQYFWNQFLGSFPFPLLPQSSAPTKPLSGWVLYCDGVDGKLKAIAASGTIVVLANP